MAVGGLVSRGHPGLGGGLGGGLAARRCGSVWGGGAGGIVFEADDEAVGGGVVGAGKLGWGCGKGRGWFCAALRERGSFGPWGDEAQQRRDHARNG